MAQLVIDGLDESTIAALERLARRHQITLEDEAKNVLERAAHEAPNDVESAWEIADRMRERLARTPPPGGFSDSGELQAEDRQR